MELLTAEAIDKRQDEIQDRQNDIRNRVRAIDGEAAEISQKTSARKEQDLRELRAESKRLAAEFETLKAESEVLKKQEELLDVSEIAAEVVDKIKLYRPFVKELIDKHRPDVAACLRDLVTVLFDVADDLKPERRRMLKMKAEMLYEYFSELKAAGFKTQVALQIILSQGSAGSGLTSFFASAGKAFGDAAGKAKR